ncbi:MAG: site-2 protease family protein [Lentisphaeria bacterium]|nr:site-2 protease family protein [Lentisphaeria bacterium]
MVLEILQIAGACLFVVFFFGMCVFSHELGHFLAGRWRKLHIDAFSIGFRKVWGKKINGVEYRIGCIPLGGYVELPQIDATGEVPHAADGTELKRAKPLDRIITAFAGPLFNVLFGLALGTVIWLAGIPQDSPKLSSFEVISVPENSSEYQAGLRAGDRIVAINGENFRCTWAKFIEKSMFVIGDITLTVERDGKPVQICYTPQPNPDAPGRLAREKIAYPFYKVRIPLEMHPESGGPAALAGVRQGDILLAVNGRSVASFAELSHHFVFAREPLKLTLRRGDSTVVCDVMPEPVEDAEYGWKVGVSFAGREAVIMAPLAGSPAERAGLQADDTILTCDGQPVADAGSFIAKSRQSTGGSMELTVRRGESVLTVTLTPEKVCPRQIGISMQLYDHPTPFEQFRNILRQTWLSLRGMAVSGAHSVGLTEKTSSIKPHHMSGPLGIIDVLYHSVRKASVMTGLYFVVVISFALAIFNLLPLPVLDGGHIVFGLIELVFRKPLPTSLVKVLNAVFIGLLLMLMLYVSYFDVRRMLPAKWMSSAAPAVQTTEPVSK